jgi:hypothetical protein
MMQISFSSWDKCPFRSLTKLLEELMNVRRLKSSNLVAVNPGLMKNEEVVLIEAHCWFTWRIGAWHGTIMT